MNFSFCGALEAKKLIEACYCQAKNGLWDSLKKQNSRRIKYWVERVGHLMGELNWVDEIIEELKAVPEDRL